MQSVCRALHAERMGSPTFELAVSVRLLYERHQLLALRLDDPLNAAVLDVQARRVHKRLRRLLGRPLAHCALFDLWLAEGHSDWLVAVLRLGLRGAAPAAPGAAALATTLAGLAALCRRAAALVVVRRLVLVAAALAHRREEALIVVLGDVSSASLALCPWRCLGLTRRCLLAGWRARLRLRVVRVEKVGFAVICCCDATRGHHGLLLCGAAGALAAGRRRLGLCRLGLCRLLHVRVLRLRCSRRCSLFRCLLCRLLRFRCLVLVVIIVAR